MRHTLVDIPRLSKAGMPSRSEGWGGLFKDESTDYQTTPALRAPTLLRRGIVPVFGIRHRNCEHPGPKEGRREA
jgi:hypothetical protein